MTSVIGVDLGGTKVAVAPLVGRHFGESVLLPTDRSGSGALIEQLVAMVNKIRSDDLAAVGIGVPSIVEFETGTRRVIGKHPARRMCRCGHVLGERLGVPVFVDNDATVAALAEAHDDRAPAGRPQPGDDHDRNRGRGRASCSAGGSTEASTGGAGEFGHTLVGLDLSGPAVPSRRAFPQPGLARVRGGGARARPARG